MKKYTAAQINKMPCYWDVFGKSTGDRMEYYWYYFSKYHGYNDFSEISVEDADNEWGIIFVIIAYFRNSDSAAKFHSFNKYMLWDEKNEEREFIPVRCDKVVGSKGRKYLERNIKGKKRKTIKRKPR